MRYFALFFVLLSALGAWAQTAPQTQDAPEPVQTVSKASLAAHKAVLDDVRKRVHQMTAGVPLNKY